MNNFQNQSFALGICKTSKDLLQKSIKYFFTQVDRYFKDLKGEGKLDRYLISLLNTVANNEILNGYKSIQNCIFIKYDKIIYDE